MNPWGLTEWLWLIGLLATSSLAIWAIVVTKRSGNQRHKLLFVVDSTPLVSEHSRGRGLVVSYNSEQVEDPRLVRVILKNIGPTDITSADFDAGRDLQVCIEPDTGMELVPIRPDGDILDVLDFQYLEPDGSRDVSNHGFNVLSDSVPISPMLLRRGASVTFDLLVDGPVEVYLKNPLINTDVVDTTPTQRSAAVLDALAGRTLGYATAAALVKGINTAVRLREDGRR